MGELELCFICDEYVSTRLVCHAFNR